MKQQQLQELIRVITRHVLREFQNIDPTSDSSIHQSSNSTNPEKKSADDAEDDLMNKIDKRHDIEQKMKDTELKRKAEESDYKRNQSKIQQYRNATKPSIKREQDGLKQQLRSI